MFRKTALAFAVIAVGCAARKPEQVKVAKNDVPYSSEGQPKPRGVLRCHMEEATGSNYMERVCKYDEPAETGDTTLDDAMIEAQRRALQHVCPDGTATKCNPF